MNGLAGMPPTLSSAKAKSSSSLPNVILGSIPAELQQEKGNGSHHRDGDGNDDLTDVELESLSGISARSSAGSDQTKTSKTIPELLDTQQQLLDHYNSRTMQLLAKYQNPLNDVDPLSEFHRYYQCRGLTGSLKQHFRDYEFKRQGKESYWKSVFSSPIPFTQREEGGHFTIVHSSIPFSILTHTSNTKVLEKTKALFGVFVLDHEGVVYFSSKKGARKSVAVTVLEMIQNRNLNVNHTQQSTIETRADCVMFRSLQDAVAKGVISEPFVRRQLDIAADSQVMLQNKPCPSDLPPVAPAATTNTNTTPSVNQPEPRHKARVSKWAKHLNQLGIDSSTLDISFHERVSCGRKLSNNSFPGWLYPPTEYCCIMTTGKPISLTAVGMPCQSKREAVESAANLLYEELSRQLRLLEKKGDEQMPIVSDATNRKLIEHGTDDARYQQKLSEWHRIHSRVPKLGTYAYPLPSWACSPLESVNARGKKDMIFFLHELSFWTESGEAFVPTRMGLKEHACTRMGILFPQDPLSQSPLGTSIEGISVSNGNTNHSYYPFEATFDVGRAGKQTVVARLENRTKVCFSGSETVLQLKHFNQIISGWKTYGFLSDNNRKPKHEDKGANCRNRTYLFVPLLSRQKQRTHSDSGARGGVADVGRLRIDWDLVNKVSQSETTPYLKSFDYVWKSSVLRHIDSWLLFCLFASFAVIAAAAGQMNLSMEWDKNPFNGALKIVSVVCAELSIICVVQWLLPPTRSISNDVLKNRFLLQRNATKNLLYVTHAFNHGTGSGRLDSLCERMPLTAKSPFLTPEALEEMSAEINESYKNKYKLDLKHATFSDYFRSRYAVTVRYERERLLAAYVIKPGKHVDFALMLTKHLFREGTAIDQERKFEENEIPQNVAPQFLIPEFVQILPMPRDVLYMCHYASEFMPALERIIELTHFSVGLQKCVGERIALRMPQSGNTLKCESTVQPSSVRDRAENQSLRTLLKEATTRTPLVTYQRLEFLGDSVLQFFVSVNAMARNSSLQWDCDDMGDIVSDAVKNSVLFDGGLRMGVSRLISHQRAHWSSAYNITGKKQLSGLDHALLKYKDFYAVVELGDRTVSDVVESILAAAYLAGRSKSIDPVGGCMVIGILEKLSIPMPEQPDKSLDAGWPWFSAMGTCVHAPYPYGLDKSWQQELVKIGTSIYCQHDIADKLEKGWQSLIDKFSGVRSSAALSTQQSKLLFFSALFDDSLEDDNFSSSLSSRRSSLNESLDGSLHTLGSSVGRLTDDDDDSKGAFSQAEGLHRVALARDTLFVVGNAALQLCLSEELYYRYPQATAGDLHFLRACAFNDDVLVYIMIKNEMHLCLFDQESFDTHQIQMEIASADKLGIDFWKDRDGWVLGIDVFQSRCRTRGSSTDPLLPRYPGLMGGRLWGLKKKLPKEMTGDLAFSMKAIIGALTLSAGLDCLWDYLFPLFEEVVLLSAEELRAEFGGLSEICSLYKKGR